MLLSLNWLRDFVPYEGSVDALADKLTMLGLEVDEVYHPFQALEPLVVGHVLECTPHPDADKLSVTKVDAGDEILDIVCGAPNVAAGQKVAVAKVGTTLPGNLQLKKAKIRGQASHGMICSEKELELSEEHQGIMVLDDALAPGTNLVEALGLEQVVLNIDLTPNRGDCLSMYGLAREVAMAFELPLSPPARVKLTESGGSAKDQVRIEIADGTLCPLYQARILRGVKVGPSPAWIRYRLLSVGVRPISNLVDVTNYVMMELGQPLHAFDQDLLEGGKIRVAPAENGMEFTTLDGQKRKLLASDLLIWDGVKPVALAGVMGGENTEIHGASSNVLLECAVFDPPTIRKTARRLALPSESSHRFERGVDQELSKYAVNRAAELMQELAGGEVLQGVSLAEPAPWSRPKLTFRPSRASAVVGIDFSASFCARTLAGLGCSLEEEDSAQWMVYPPSHRPDLEREIDLVEEVARVYGLDRIPARLPRVARDVSSAVSLSTHDFLRRLKLWARGAGLAECINYSFVSAAELDRLGEPAEGRVAIANPLSEDQGVMRTNVCAGLLQSLTHNLSQGNRDLRLFEAAKTFHADPESDTTVREQNRLAILLHGSRFFGGYPWPEHSSDYPDLKGLLEDLVRSLGLPAPAFALAKTPAPWLAPCVEMHVAGAALGYLGKVDAELADELNARDDVWIADVNADALMELFGRQSVQFSELPRYPHTSRDVTLVAPKGLPVGQVVEAVSAQNEKLLEDVRLIDVFEPESGETKNLTYRLRYRSPSKTLKDKEADKVHRKLVQAVMDKLPVTLQK